MNNIVIKAIKIVISDGISGLWKNYLQCRNMNRQLKQHIKGIRKNTFSKLEQWDGNKISFPISSENPDISIVIPVYNNIIYIYNCLNSILKNTNGSFEVVIVDDASNDETPGFLMNIENIKLIRNESNMGFIESCNKGAASSNGKYIFFLNNDTVVTENWLEPLMDVISKEDVGVVGSKLIYPDGKLQEAGGIIWNDASGWNFGKFDDSNRPEYNFVREVDYCSGAALLVKKELFEKIGGFDERFKPAYYEDTDLCFSIRKLGYKVIYQPKSVIIHFEGATSGIDIKSGVKRYQEINKAKFFSKWKEILEKEHFPPDAVKFLFYARNKMRGENILIIDRYIPTFDKDSGSYRMYNILRILSELGHKVTFIGDNLMLLEPYAEILQQYGIEIIYSPYVNSIKQYLENNGKFFEIVIMSRSDIAVNHISYVKKYCSMAKIIFDTVDLHYLRETRTAYVEKDEKISRKANETKKMEIELARQCDVTFVVSPVEKEILMKEEPSLNVEILSNIHEIYPTVKSFSDRKDIMFLGGFDHLPNVDAVKYFVNEILPILRKEIAEIKFYIVGSNPPAEIKRLSSEDIIVTGYVKDLTPYFESCRVFVAPLRYGAGVKGKIGEAMAHGLPVVTTSIGAEGMGLIDGENILIANDPFEFARNIVMLYKGESLWNSVSKNSIEHIRKKFSFESTKKELELLLV